MSWTFRFGYPGISSSALMDALIELKDSIVLFYYATHVVEVLRCSLLQPLMGGGKLFAVWHSEYTRLRDNSGIWNNIVSNPQGNSESTEAAY